MRRSAWPWLVTLPAAALATVAAMAQPNTTPSLLTRPTLHEDVPGPAGADPASPAIGATGNGSNAAALASGDKILPEPASTPRQQDEPVYGQDGMASDRDTEWRADMDTGADGTLHYAAVFNPDVVPFKRMTVLDAVRDDYTMFTARTALTEVPVGGTISSNRDAFWASLVVDLAPGVDVAIPSVAPDMRVLSAETTPRTRITFSRDGADNFYVRSDEATAHGQVRLVFMVDADAGYFAPALPASRLTPAKIRDMAPVELRPSLPPTVMAEARKTLDKLDVDDRMELGVAFNKLIAYFRAFEAKPTPRSTGDIYRDLVTNQAGVCRHRAFAFMVTANALGLPTRYVTNEAHAFVEVWLGDRGWERIDLGGAALRMDVSNAEGKTLHRPRAEDPFSKPKEYGNSYTHLDGDIRGLSEDQLDDKHADLDAKPASGEPPLGGGGGNGGAGAGGAGGDGSGSGGGGSSPDQGLPTSTTPDPAKLSPSVRVRTAAPIGYRGEALQVQGQVTVAQRGVAQLPVQVFLAPVGQLGEEAVFIGSGVTDGDGNFKLDLTLPGSLDLASYDVWVSTNEDARYNAATSD